MQNNKSKIQYSVIMINLKENLDGFYMIGYENGKETAQEMKLKKGENIIKIPRDFLDQFMEGFKKDVDQKIVNFIKTIK